MELLLRIFGITLRILGIFLDRIMPFFFPRRRGKTPPITDKLLLTPAVELAEQIRTKKIKSEDLVKACIEQVKKTNKVVNAVVEDRFEQAIEEAKKADQMAATMPEIYLIQNYPLLGIPFTVKESIGIKGLLQTAGSLFRRDYRASKDGVAVQRLKEAGGIPLLVSNTPEWCMSWETYNHVNGRTLNPYDLGRTPGGSSGGEAALISAGASIFGLGSDIAGSIRLPSHFCGIFGHKPTGELVSLDGHFPNSSDPDFQRYLAIGPMCRYAKDLPTILHVISGSNGSKLNLDKPLHTKDIRIFYIDSFGYSLANVPVEKDIRNAQRQALEHFKHNGLHVERLKGIDMSNVNECCLTLLLRCQGMPDLLASKEGERASTYKEMIKALVGMSMHTFAGVFLMSLYDFKALFSSKKGDAYVEEWKRIREQLIEKLGDNGVLFLPTYHRAAPHHYLSFTSASGVAFTQAFNKLGFPATAVPLGMNRDNLPIGIQVVAAPYQDRLCLAIARELEAAFGGWMPPL